MWQFVAHSKLDSNVVCKLLLLTSKKSHTSFQLVPESVTLNDPEWHMAVILHYYTKCITFQNQLCQSGCS